MRGASFLVAVAVAAEIGDLRRTATHMTRRYGRRLSGQRLVAAVPHGHWRTTILIAGLRQSGIVAPLVLGGPMTGTAFCADIEQCLAPALAPGDVVVLDNLAAHKDPGGRQAIAAAGAALLYLPPADWPGPPSAAESPSCCPTWIPALSSSPTLGCSTM